MGVEIDAGTGVGIDGEVGAGVGCAMSALEITPRAKAQDSTAHLAASSAKARLSCSRLVSRANKIFDGTDL